MDLPPFVQDALYWGKATGGHILFMFWWIWLAAMIMTSVSESFLVEPRHRRILERPDDGLWTVRAAVRLGILSPPSRTRIFREARHLLAADVSPAGVLAYLISAQTVLLWMLFFIVALNGPQPALGLLVAILAAGLVLGLGLRLLPGGLWDEARRRARAAAAEGSAVSPIARSGSIPRRLASSLAGQAYSLAGPLLYGVAGAGFLLALGQSPGSFSLQGSRGPLIQAANSAAGLVIAYVSGAPMVGNALFAAGLWKPGFVTYAGLTAFYLGTLVMPFALPRYLELFGPQLFRKLLVWSIPAILAGALAATAWWWGLDALAGVIGVREWFETLTDSTLRPNDVPWFHHWFAPEI